MAVKRVDFIADASTRFLTAMLGHLPATAWASHPQWMEQCDRAIRMAECLSDRLDARDAADSETGLSPRELEREAS